MKKEPEDQDNRRIVIDAPADKLQQFQDDLASDPDLLDQLADDPQKTLKGYGIEVDDVTANSIKNHFSNLVGGGPGASPVTIAVGIAIAAAVAVP